jgi:hypothetical protein
LTSCRNCGEYGAGRWASECQTTLGKLTSPLSSELSGGLYILQHVVLLLQILSGIGK